MRYIEAADFRVSSIGLGARSLGAADGDGDRWAEVIAYALESGINLVDTAPLYQQGASEELLGGILRGSRGDVILSTKVGTHGMEQSLNRQAIEETLHQSLRRLRTDYIDILHIHYPDPRADYDEVARVIEDLQQEGTIRSYGLSNFDSREYERWPLDDPPVTMQLPYNLLQWEEYDGMKDILRHADIIPLVYTPLAGGLLTASPDEVTEHPMARMLYSTMADRDSRRLTERLGHFHDVCREHGVAPAAAATAWSLNCGRNAVLVGTGRVEHLKQALAALEFADEEPVRSLERIPQPIMPLHARVIRHVESRAAETLTEVEFESMPAKVAIWMPGSPGVGTIVKVDGLTGKFIE